MDKKFCFDALAEEGFQPEIDEDGDISFLAGEISLSLILDEEDKDFFSLVCAFEVDDMDQLELFYSAASEASREEKVVSADGHRQRAGTVPKRGGAGGCAADRTLRSVCRYINRKIRLHYYESMETFLHDQPSQASGHERLFCGGVIQTGIIT